MTTLANYQARAAATAQPAAYDHNYLIPMIVGELGELFGQQAKSVWHGWDADKLKEELVLEYGDICWGVAILLEMEGVQSVSGNLLVPGRSIWGTQLSPWHTLLQKATGLHLFYATGAGGHAYISAEAQQLWTALEKYCGVITGAPFEVVLDANIKKLASRAARGVLQGAGDHR
jgi:hypothetical protein